MIKGASAECVFGAQSERVHPMSMSLETKNIKTDEEKLKKGILTTINKQGDELENN